MKNSHHGYFFKAISSILKPLIKIAIRKGIPCKSIEEILRLSYVETAAESFSVDEKKVTNSRIAVLTGLSRKEVLRLKEHVSLEDDSGIEQYNRCSRVITAWRREPEYCNQKGEPLQLWLDKGEVNFKSLVKAFSGDMTYTALLDELIQSSNVELQRSGKIKLLSTSYVGKRGEKQAFTILGEDASYLIKTIDHNVENPSKDSRFQKKVSYNNIPASILPKFKKICQQKSQLLLEDLDQFLAQYQDKSKDDSDPQIHKTGLSIFYFEEDK
jgi:hypothetical protein